MTIRKEVYYKSPFTGEKKWHLFADLISYARLLPFYIDERTDGLFYVRPSICGLGANGEDLWLLCDRKYFRSMRDALAYVRECLRKYGWR